MFMFDGTRLFAACVVVVLYLATTAWFLRPLWRRRPEPLQAAGGASTLIAFASQTGFAEQIAAQTAKSLTTAGAPIHLSSLAQIDLGHLPQVERALFVVSTTGEGDAPDPVA